ncbi:hypothetical protein B0H12DRAFT_151544 [Mycena haematopus]|nr:hypothetical protein B0H12DRAFT_151544 [Mycena haematopus]
MHSIPLLRARIAKLDTEIGLQRQLLKKLECDKSLVQRQLNDVLDPVARLPLEISSEIFLQSLPPFPIHEARNAPMLLLNICNRWTDIALSTPALWTAIHINFPCANGLKEILPVWLKRAHNRPLFVSLQVDGAFDEDVAAIIWRHGSQLKRLEICDMRREDKDGNVFDSATPGPLQALESLTIRGDPEWSFYAGHILGFLRLAPNLIECFVYDTKILLEDGIEKVSFPKLRRLMFGEPGVSPEDGEGLRRCLELPRLEALRIGMFSDELLDFLKESSPPLLELVLNTIGAIDFVALAGYVPHLTLFEVWYPEEYLAVENLFVALAEFQSLLPHLDTLAVYSHRFMPEDSDSFWTTLTRALAARRTQIQIFRLTVTSDMMHPSTMPSPDILAAIRELVVDGMQVCISASQGSWNLLD